MMDERAVEWALIGLMGIVTLATRVAGVGMARWIPQTPYWQRFMNYLPATLLVAIAIPSFATGDIPLTIAAVLTLVFAAFRFNLVVSMGVGVTAVALLRRLL
jgi:uncharacterized membrane protein